MATDYQKIGTRDKEEYAAELVNLTEFLSRLYANSTHFIFELLQNTEDALARNHIKDYPRTVTFNLSENELRFSHFGEPFTENDVKAISRSLQSTKSNTNAIGKFGIGFKSVYVYTDRPEIHSGDEHFVIEKYIFPKEVIPVDSEQGQTIFILPFKSDAATAFDDIKNELFDLEPNTLLFLREIEEICWAIENGPSGRIHKGVEDCVLKGVCQVQLSGSNSHGTQISQIWIVFSRELKMPELPEPRYVEIAFLAEKADNDKGLTISGLNTSPLMVYFRTAVQTNLGFLMQGPYQTTPSRDNIADNEWNIHLIKETAALLVDALREFRDEGLLDASILMTLPLAGC